MASEVSSRTATEVPRNNRIIVSAPAGASTSRKEHTGRVTIEDIEEVATVHFQLLVIA